MDRAAITASNRLLCNLVLKKSHVCESESEGLHLQASVDYVLSRFFEEEKPIVRSTIDRAVEAVKCAIDNDLISAMNIFNKTEEL